MPNPVPHAAITFNFETGKYVRIPGEVNKRSDDVNNGSGRM
jgi:hypothetical protein